MLIPIILAFILATAIAASGPTPGHTLYLPLIGSPAKVIGVSMAVGYESCAYPPQIGATWYYDWKAQPLECPGSQAIPMIYGPQFRNADISDSAYVLLLNECDLGCDDAISRLPETEAAVWHEQEERFPNHKLIGPNVSHHGLQWLLDWHAAYVRMYGKPPRIYAMGVHCYLEPEQCKDWITTNIELAKQWTTSGKVWVTEWAILPCRYAMPDDAVPDADEFMAWLLANPGVEREAWFIARWFPTECNTDLFDTNGNLTTLGKWHQVAASKE